MALQLTSTITTNDGIELQNAYARVMVIDDIKGDVLTCYCVIYFSKQAFENNASGLNLSLETQLYAPYDRNTMTTDILDLAHDRLIEVLASQGVVAVKIL